MRRRRTSEFEAFVRVVEPRLRRAMAGCRGPDDALDGIGEALAYAWEHWDDVRGMRNPAGFLFRVAQSRTRPRRTGAPLPPPAELGVVDVEPRLVRALMNLPERQRTAVWLVHACQWHYGEVAAAMGTSPSTVGTHVSRGLANLRRQLEEAPDARRA